ncbi:hemolysin family protein [Pajaroellobacter abortibovis]|uniref:HlyC/CorC family transporter n=1 Tax=Pajaroellobacter abortibovis TaxID=1882918 RepID=A0A1L6MZ58_9BACT|nr:hemolysin family protein [Pajaroellobacter abortibovis]APS00675.1 hypothetical protein BCY86_08300 [Pajaroellobacter abortibovis]
MIRYHNPTVGLIIALISIVLNGVFVAAEFALVKVRAIQLRSRIRKGEQKAIAAQRVIERLDRYLSVTQLGITLTSLGLGWVGEPAITRTVERTVELISGHALSRSAYVGTVIAGFSFITFAHILFGELVPKLIAIQRSEQTALYVAIPLRFLHAIFFPILWILEKTSRIILKRMGMSPTGVSEGTLSEEEILGVLIANTVLTPDGKDKMELLERVLHFSSHTARHALVPRVDIAFLSIDEPGAKALEFFRTHQYSRFILTKGRSLDEAVGYMYAKDFLLHPEALNLSNLTTLRRDVLFVSETQSLVDILREMQRTHTPIAIVVDEYGGTSGLLTIEDLLEEIVGQIRDEFDEEPVLIHKIPNEENTWDVDGRISYEELRAIHWNHEWIESREQLGTVMLQRLGRLPRVGDQMVFPGATAEITGISRRRITRVRIRVQPASQVKE